MSTNFPRDFEGNLNATDPHCFDRDEKVLNTVSLKVLKMRNGHQYQEKKEFC